MIMLGSSTIKATILFLLVSMTLSTNLILISQINPIEFYQCMKDNGIKRAAIMALTNEDRDYDYQVDNIKRAQSMDIQLEIYSLVSRYSPEQQLEDLANVFGKLNIKHFWLCPYSFDPSWKEHTPEENCKFFQWFVEELTKKGFEVDIVTSADQWKLAFKSRLACPDVNSRKLWWIPTES